MTVSVPALVFSQQNRLPAQAVEHAVPADPAAVDHLLAKHIKKAANGSLLFFPPHGSLLTYS